ncbi:hypothetical protein [uncultured Enterovirga sp.]|uniref:hypothetical protein n=1 Tax=uncultured Enterovirga sp. TaxID=2026352 RepID=UPI0035CC8D88
MVRLIEATAQSRFKRETERPLCDWTARSWKRAAEQQAFALRNPRVNGPAVLEAVAASTGDLPSAARIALSALPAVHVRLAPEIRQELERLGRQPSPT